MLSEFSRVTLVCVLAHLARCLLLAICAFGSVVAIAADANEWPAPLVSSCSIDLNGDGRLDLAILVGRGAAFEVIVLTTVQLTYRVDLIYRGADRVELSCKAGNSVRASAAGVAVGPANEERTMRGYIVLRQPEGSATAHFWQDGRLVEVWVAD
jgi:hypothetical protein